MADCTEYTAVTLGPISDTFQLTSTPAGTWCASYIFSWLAKEMIVHMRQEGKIERECFIAPVFEEEDGSIFIPGGKEIAARGVGLFFDHIIVSGNCLNEAMEARRVAIEKLAEQVAVAIGQTADTVHQWLTDYLRIYIAVKEVPEGEGVIAAFGSTLAALECEPHYCPEDKINPLLALFEGDSSDNKNSRLKKFELVKSLDNWMLYAPGPHKQIRNIESIANPESPKNPVWKSEEYYCILNSDGDSMGKLFKDCGSDGKAKELSRRSFQYCVQSAKLILRCGGVPLYAGGDDLLAILPVMVRDPDNQEKEISVFQLVNRLNQEFNTVFSSERELNPGKPSLSVGLSIQHVHSPLYEALYRAIDLLHKAKASSGMKNGLCVDLQKHSGQNCAYSVRVVSDNSDLLGMLDEMIADVRGSKNRAQTKSSAKQDETIFLSGAGYVLETYSALFASAIRHYIEDGCTGRYIGNFFKNMFDNEAQNDYGTYLGKLCKYCELTVRKHFELKKRELAEEGGKENRILTEADLIRMTKEKLKPADIADRCADAVRILRFMTEAPGKE
jgi:Predicted hydrolase of the HD superfamily (permuted catalytic motifs)